MQALHHYEVRGYRYNSKRRCVAAHLLEGPYDTHTRATKQAKILLASQLWSTLERMGAQPAHEIEIRVVVVPRAVPGETYNAIETLSSQAVTVPRIEPFAPFKATATDTHQELPRA